MENFSERPLSESSLFKVPSQLSFWDQEITLDQKQELKKYRDLYKRSLAQANLLSLESLLEYISPSASSSKSKESSDRISSTFPISLIVREWYLSIVELKFLQSLISCPLVNEIIWHNYQWLQVEIGGKLLDIKLSQIEAVDVELALESLAYLSNAIWNYSDPFVSFNWEQGKIAFRVSLVHYSLTPKRQSKLFLRKMARQNYDFCDYEIPAKMQETILEMLKNKLNIVIAGATSSGKTSLLSCLLQKISPREHLVILEDTYELCLSQDKVTHLLAREDCIKKGLSDFCAYSLRLRPDRIILGEIRGAEIVPFFLAMNTGHRGLMCTVHANSAADALTRLALLYVLYSQHKGIDYQVVEKLIERNVDAVIFMENKRVLEVMMVNN